MDLTEIRCEVSMWTSLLKVGFDNGSDEMSESWFTYFGRYHCSFLFLTAP